MNYLLPHIRRMPEKLARDQFAGDAAQKLASIFTPPCCERNCARLRSAGAITLKCGPGHSLRSSGFCCGL